MGCLITKRAPEFVESQKEFYIERLETNPAFYTKLDNHLALFVEGFNYFFKNVKNNKINSSKLINMLKSHSCRIQSNGDLQYVKLRYEYLSNMYLYSIHIKAYYDVASENAKSDFEKSVINKYRDVYPDIFYAQIYLVRTLKTFSPNDLFGFPISEDISVKKFMKKHGGLREKINAFQEKISEIPPLIRINH